MPNKQTEIDLPNWLITTGVSDLILYKIDRLKLLKFQSYKINVFIGIKRNDLDTTITDYLNGRLYSDGKIISEIIENNNLKPI